MADPLSARQVLDRIMTRLEGQGIDRKAVQLVLQAFDVAGFEMREKGGRDPVPIGDSVEVSRRQIGDTDDWLLEVDLGSAGSLVAVERGVAGRIERSEWQHVPGRLL